MDGQFHRPRDNGSTGTAREASGARCSFGYRLRHETDLEHEAAETIMKPGLAGIPVRISLQPDWGTMTRGTNRAEGHASLRGMVGPADYVCPGLL